MSTRKLPKLVVAYLIHAELNIPLPIIALCIGDGTLHACDLLNGRAVLSVDDINLFEADWDWVAEQCYDWETQKHDNDCIKHSAALERWKRVGLSAKEVCATFGLSKSDLEGTLYISDEEKYAPEPTDTRSDKELDRDECRAIAESLWKTDPHYKQMRIAKMLLTEEAVPSEDGKPLSCKWRDGKKDEKTVIRWIRDLDPAPSYGRPPSRR